MDAKNLGEQKTRGLTGRVAGFWTFLDFLLLVLGGERVRLGSVRYRPRTSPMPLISLIFLFLCCSLRFARMRYNPHVACGYKWG